MGVPVNHVWLELALTSDLDLDLTLDPLAIKAAFYTNVPTTARLPTPPNPIRPQSPRPKPTFQTSRLTPLVRPTLDTTPLAQRHPISADAELEMDILSSTASHTSAKPTYQGRAQEH